MRNSERFSFFLCSSAVFVSGFSALILQVIWTRSAVLYLGTTTKAVTIVVASFMAGLAIGSVFAAKFVKYSRFPVFIYALGEVICGVLTILIAYWIRSKGTTLVIPTTTVVAVLLVPTTVMGITLPIIIQGLSGNQTDKKIVVPILYGLNTLGGALGALLGAFWLLPNLGLWQTAHIAAFFQFFAALFVLPLVRLRHEAPIPEDSLQSRSPREPGMLLLAFWGGVSSLALELVWTRLLSLVLGPSVYAFGIVLFVYLIGIAIGALICPIVSRKSEPTNLVAICLGGLGLSVAWSTLVFGLIPFIYVWLVQWFHPDPGSLRFVELVLATVTIAPTAICHGLFLPLLILSGLRKEAVGKQTAESLAVNTIGGILGSVITGVLAIPYFGFLPVVLMILSGHLIFAALFVATRLKGIETKQRRLMFGFLFVFLGFYWMSAHRFWDQTVLASGVYKYAVGGALGGKNLPLGLGELIYFKEGASSTVAVIKTEQDRVLTIDGKADASAMGDQSTQVLLAALPLSLSKEAKSTLVIGFASGVTAGVAALFDSNQVTSVEIEPAVYEAARYFEDVNHRALETVSRKVVEDARHFLLTTPEQFDVITSEPSNPWMSGVAPLFTKEFFSLAARRLSQGGIMCQWLPIYGMTPPLVSSVLRTFSEAFAHVVVFESVDGFDLLLIGSHEPIAMSPNEMERRWTRSELRQELSEIRIHSAWDLLGKFLMGTKGVHRFSEQARVNTDNNGYLEFQAPFALHFKTAEQNHIQLLRESDGIGPYVSRDYSEKRIRDELVPRFLMRNAQRLAEQLHAPH